MPQKLLPLVISLVLVGIGGRSPEGRMSVGLSDESVNDIVLELDYIDQGLFGWEGEWLWFEKVNTTDEIQEIIDHNKWYSHITFKKWAELNPVSVGLWVLFYQELPPEFGLGPPFIGNKGSFGTKNQHNLFITYFMYGTCSMEIYAEDAFIKSIENPCGRSCSFDFHTARVPFNEDPYQVGKYRFRINFKTARPGDFLIIDMIQVDNVQLTTPTPCDCKPCYQVLDNNSKESLEGWNVTDNLLEHFHDVQDIEDNLGDVLPPEFDYSAFEGAEGIWVAINEPQINSELPAFEYGDDEFDYVEITSYLHNDSSLSVYIGDSSEPEILANDEEGLRWSVFRVDMDGAEKFRVEVNLTDAGYFAFVDKIIARRSACPIPEDSGSADLTTTTSPPEICICPTTSATETSLEPATRPTDETDEPEDTTTRSTGKTSGSPNHPNSSTTTESPTTKPGGPNGESNLSNNWLLVLFLTIGIYYFDV